MKIPCLFAKEKDGPYKGKVVEGEYYHPAFKVIRPEFGWQFYELLEDGSWTESAPGIYTLNDAIQACRAGSFHAEKAVGIVGESTVPLQCLNNGAFMPLRWSLKTTDFPKEVR